eukprot:6212168-Pleurochrysis_carterae.AAC.2
MAAACACGSPEPAGPPMHDPSESYLQGEAEYAMNLPRRHQRRGSKWSSGKMPGWQQTMHLQVRLASPGAERASSASWGEGSCGRSLRTLRSCILRESKTGSDNGYSSTMDRGADGVPDAAGHLDGR